MKRSTGSSTKAETFVDTSGFYALLVQGDSAHLRAKALLARAARTGARFVTTDYVLDETATLLKSRRLSHLAVILFEKVLPSAACRVEWMDPDRFEQVRQFFLKHSDQDWSFTDCASFCVMRNLRIRDALSTDAHFRHAGFQPLLV
jgi:predicted nucleic acid-binding protein